ncbi:uncharacterized protein LOC111680823 [Lucilia cuprina]|uniref:uncharacterized protein LOC111680823 n=1 Tax=Lucilia cuprina TaxID=7375 RepID=UPI001F065AF2|nr:uncharacterized protein LOC111680823 [Lucilia cuprina]
MHLKRIIEIIFNTFLMMQLIHATPYSWGTHHSNYDASLDPIAWSRNFVKDTIRKPRLYRTNSLEHNSIDVADDDFPIQNYGGFGKRRSSRGNFANDISNNWYSNPKVFIHHGKYNNMQKRMNRRRQKLNARHRYGLV